MTTNAHLAERWARCTDELHGRNQDHVLGLLATLEDTEKAALLGDIEAIPWSLLDPLLATHVLSTPQQDIPKKLEPARVYPSAPPPDRAAEYEEARRVGPSVC